ncbi:MAG TPA: DUF2480 family protein [Saprospiraceae bacterium]|nr:DUF2480 family protein [Saprospiraceae bacterium]HMQ84951.1 DUF2480 family protein [Saprospiraceae bacterium]
MENTLVNRVAESGLITLKLEDFFPDAPVKKFDLKDFLFQGLMLREKDFRESLKNHDWDQYRDCILLVVCSADAIIPLWAYMLVAAYAQPIVKDQFFGAEKDYYQSYFTKVIATMDAERYRDERIVIKGCSDRPIPESAYLALTAKLQPVAKSIFFGEPCSTVPIYKRK